MKRMLKIAVILVVSMFISCAVFISDNDDDDYKNSNSSKDTITIIYSQQKGNPVSAR